ncbi:MAG: LuxR family transcriptional regulator [Collinsella sp.]|nr:LuxR family transcriptional regulator [Collinsella sp.]
MTVDANLPGRPITIDEWFRLLGKGSLQDYQDCYTAETGIALSLLGRAGNRLLLPSKEKWFCQFSRAHYSHSCTIETRDLIHALIERYEARREFVPSFFSCDFGLTEFFLPIYFDNRLMAFWVGGGFVKEDQYRAEVLARKFDVVIMSDEALRRAVRRLAATTKLLNINLSKTDAEIPATHRDAVFETALTKREREVARLVCRGMSNREVAQALFLSEKTVKSHMSNILSKLGVRDRAQLVFEYGSRHDSKEPR